MKTERSVLGKGAIGFLAAVAVLLVGTGCGQMTGGMDGDDLGGVVTSSQGPEAGVWVIAQTDELPTPFAKMVVTDDQGRYLLPDLPEANYNVWVRGYGLVDSPKVSATPGTELDMTAVVAPDAAAAAEYYPANYWYSMLNIPAESEFPGTGQNGISPEIESQAHWMRNVRTDGCVTCHQLGNKATREIPENLGEFDSGAEAWLRRIQSGQAGPNMIRNFARMGQQRAAEMYGDWTDRIQAGELPRETPPRPQGLERNVVVTVWDWADPKVYLHDEIASDRRNPTVNANGPIYGALEASADYLPVLDPVANEATQVPLTVRDPETPTSRDGPIPADSPYWGDEAIWDSQANVHNPMFDHLGRVWITARIRPPETPAWCREGSDHPSAMLFPMNQNGRQAGVYDPRTQEYTTIDTCFSTHHLQFAPDENHTLWFSAGGPGSGVVGWLNTRMFDETGDEQMSQGWTAIILDTNGNGERDEYVEPDEPVDPSKDKRIVAAFYGIAPNPADGSVWGSVLGFPGSIVRLDPGSNPPATALSEVYEIPWENPEAPVQGYAPRGMDIDSNGIVWTVLSSGHFASFDRSKCTGPLNGPTATGQHCPEGWTLHELPGPKFEGVAGAGTAEASYYSWVDQHDTFGLGENVPIATGSNSDSLLAFKDGEWLILRVPYPMGFYTKGLDGRIDDPDAGWKGRGLWATYGTRAPFHAEGGHGAPSRVVKFQIRPDPLTP